MIELLQINCTRSLVMFHKARHRVEVRLRGQARHGSSRQINHIHSSLNRLQISGRLDGRSIVRVQMQGNADGFFEFGNQFFGRKRREQTRHIFDCQKCAHLHPPTALLNPNNIGVCIFVLDSSKISPV